MRLISLCRIWSANVIFSYVAYVCYVEDCKFSTSTHVHYRIVQNITSAICGYFYGSWGPSGRSEIVYIVQKVEKLRNPFRGGIGVSYFRDISSRDFYLVILYPPLLLFNKLFQYLFSETGFHLFLYTSNSYKKSDKIRQKLIYKYSSKNHI